jgi:hypothetical protein
LALFCLREKESLRDDYFIGGSMKCLKLGFMLAALFALGGCVSSLECGTKGDESYVSVVNVKDGPTVRNYGELCAFAYEGDE